ncbi:hypothetical protein Acsp06_06440 [Actinomycetospora sp. NBRC 106375]|uniref:ABC transporter ATP-binding protein n=1 Tax=Actinomycetospora sp. NBRC 106375 TaxID=3032207 RepID=UPI0024A0EC5D|nr:ATP-binding cassette domain-containing protein [Actinomycetospora sp. NBRC 106375]GLZ44459.1 hypothetical protein Acsp06_06440 [Actinomycetospora sp. NBRC 106375]
MPGPAILAQGLRHAYGDHTVLDGIDLRVEEGSIHALLGPNGAGKTTVVRILSTLVSPTAGDVRVAGHDLAADPQGVRAAIGVTGQFSAVDGLLTGTENLRLMADLRHLGRREGRRRTAELIERFDLAAAADRPAATYSGGMRRRLDLAMTLLGDPHHVDRPRLRAHRARGRGGRPDGARPGRRARRRAAARLPARGRAPGFLAALGVLAVVGVALAWLSVVDGTPVAGSTLALALAWCVAIGLGGWLPARRLYARSRS